MDITREMDITPEQFFNEIERTVMDDAARATGTRPTRRKLNGLKYRQLSRQGGKAGTEITVKILKYRYPEVYEVRFTYSTGTNTVRYHVVPRGEGGLTLTYSEKFVDPNPRSGLFADWWLKHYEKKAARRANHTLDAIERDAKRGGGAHGSNPLLDAIENED